MTPTVARATINDLMRFDGKAELIGGRIVPQMPAGRRHNRVAARIFRALDDFAHQAKVGEAYTDNMTFSVEGLSTDRESFSPDAAYYHGSLESEDDDPGVIDDAPTFAVEVRGDDDYGNAAEAQMSSKRAEYFDAGTKVVWDVDPEAKVVHSYRRNTPDQPGTFSIGQTADAEPAVPGWRIDVDVIFAH